jgi:hypothetical protein
MLVLRDFELHDFELCNSEEVLTPTEIDYYLANCYLRTFIDTDTNEIVAVGMTQECGEIGLVIDTDLLRNHIRKFYTLLVIFAAESFAFVDTDALFTGIVPTARDTRWIKFLGFTKTNPDIDHLLRGWDTYELPLDRWVR